MDIRIHGCLFLPLDAFSMKGLCIKLLSILLHCASRSCVSRTTDVALVLFVDDERGNKETMRTVGFRTLLLVYSINVWTSTSFI
jgi:hypothetical protein